MVSYRATDDDVYVNGTFDIDVHYYSGSPSTNYTLDVVLNETEAGAVSNPDFFFIYLIGVVVSMGFKDLNFMKQEFHF